MTVAELLRSELVKAVYDDSETAVASPRVNNLLRNVRPAAFQFGRYRTWEGTCRHCHCTVHIDTDGDGRVFDYNPDGSVHRCNGHNR